MAHFARPSRKTALAAATGAAALAAGAWWFTDRAPYPYAQRRLLDLQLPFLGLADLDTVLRPRPGERMLELGPGTGLQALHVAPQLGPQGRLDIVDVQQERLDHVMRRAQEDRAEGDGPGAIVPHLADARELPFEEAEFDAVYLVTALGEIPEPERVLADAARVLKPGGRLVVGEFFDRHWIPFQRLHRMADSQGLHLLERRGPSLAYLAAFRPCATETAGAGAA
ncbi:methyltransferase domain-containing protein [Catenulispora sp. NF23]|uniref:class I SAM-dependent methyltransferase n=1 Tax=Catenulispora pinistramenti TaxID=2705254 RepID=UPI001BAA7A6E|nr:methyltransferase domain-containing protein [Catenulispora pinistramenti]MBS2534004.1 methyltransferase domain-containing protein [Catenulispora pinistramenti]